MNRTITVPLDLLKASVAATSKAGAFCEKIAATQGIVASKVGLVVDSLVKNAVIDDSDRRRTADMLMDPVQALDITSRLADMAAQPRTMGQVAEKRATFDPQNPARSESDRVFENVLNQVPA